MIFNLHWHQLERKIVTLLTFPNTHTCLFLKPEGRESIRKFPRCPMNYLNPFPVPWHPYDISRAAVYFGMWRMLKFFVLKPQHWWVAWDKDSRRAVSVRTIPTGRREGIELPGAGKFARGWQAQGRLRRRLTPIVPLTCSGGFGLQQQFSLSLPSWSAQTKHQITQRRMLIHWLSACPPRGTPASQMLKENTLCLSASPHHRCFDCLFLLKCFPEIH